MVCANDTVAARLIRFLRDMAARPGRQAVTGFGNLPPLDALGLTTVAQPFEEMGRVAGEILLARLCGEKTPPTREMELPVTRIVRGSCGAPAG